MGPDSPLFRWDTLERKQCRAVVGEDIRAAGSPRVDEAPNRRARASAPCNRWGLPEAEGFQKGTASPVNTPPSRVEEGEGGSLAGGHSREEEGVGACWGPARAGKVEEPFGSAAESSAAFLLPPRDLPSDEYRK